MFLDDQLYLHVKNREVKKAEDMQTCINECYKICEEYFKPKLTQTMSYKEGTQLMDKVFRFWDMFIAKLEKDNWWGTDIFKIEGVSYKERYLSHPELKNIYDRGK